MRLILDTTVLLNFARAERLELLASLDVVVGALVTTELRFWPPGTSRQGQPLELRAALPSARPVALRGPEEERLFVKLRDRLGAGEAEAAAIAHSRGFTLATDDAAAHKIVGQELPQLEVSTTIRILSFLVERGRLSQTEAEHVLGLMRQRGGRLPLVRIGPGPLARERQQDGRPRSLSPGDKDKKPKHRAAASIPFLVKAAPIFQTPRRDRGRGR